MDNENNGNKEKSAENFPVNFPLCILTRFD